MLELPDLLLASGINLRQVGNEYSCLCYAHDDHHPSMSIYRNGDGGWRAHCHSCGHHSDTIAAYCYLNDMDTKNPEHFLKAKAALEGGDIYTGKPFAIIENGITKLTPRPERTMLIPTNDTKPPKMNWLKGKDGREWGEPDEVFVFRQPDGTHWMYEARWNITNIETGEIKKEPRVFSYGRRGSKPPNWECAHHFPPRPLFGLDVLAKLPKAQVVVCEGARKAQAAQTLIPMLACVGWAGGAQSWSKSDWSVIKNKSVILWPDADEPGRNCMAEIAQQLVAQGCTCHILDTNDKPNAWDAVDAADEGWDTQRTLAWAREKKGDAVKSVEKKTPEKSVDNHSERSGSFDQPAFPDYLDEELNLDEPPYQTINSEGAFTENGITWVEPGDIFHEIQSPEFRHDIVPECLRDWIADTAGVKGVDPSMLALSAIVASAGCLHEAIKLQPERTNPSWQESARLWGAIVGSSGIKKSPAIGAAVSRLKKIQLELSKKAEEKWDEVKAREMAYELANKEYIKAISKNDPMASEKKPFKPEIPEIPRIFFEDITIEKLSEELKYSPRGAFILRDELSGWFGSHAQYRSSGSDAPAWLDFYEGGAKYIDRIGRGSVFVPNWGGCIMGGIQPSTMQKIIENLPEDGLLQRFIVVNARQGNEGNEKPYNKAANDRYHDMLQRIFDTLPSDMPVMLSPEANDIRREITAYSNKLLRTGMISTGFCSHLAKYEGLCARLMLTFHAIECADRRAHPQGCGVSGKTAETVKKFMLKFLLPHAISFYINLASQSQVGHAIRKVGELCLIAKTGDIASRDIQRGWIGWRHYKPYDQEIVLQSLVDQGWILPHPKARLSSHGQPTRWLINPRLADTHALRKAEEIERRKVAVEAIEQCRADAKFEE